MGFFSKRRDQKNERKRIRQNAKTARVESRTRRQIVKAQYGIDTASNITGSIASAAGKVAIGAINPLGGLAGSPGAFSATARTGADSFTGFVPILLAGGAVLFALFGFGNLKAKK